MKRTAITAILILALLTSGCSLTDTADTAMETAPKQELPIKTEYLWENGEFYVAAADRGFGLYNRSDGSLVREYSDFRILSALEEDGSVSKVPLATGVGDFGLPALFGFDAENGEYTRRLANYRVCFMGDFAVTDSSVFTANGRLVGSALYSALPENEPAYNEAVILAEGESSARIYLTEITDADPLIPPMDDKTEYLGFTSPYRGKYIGIYRENEAFKYRIFTVDMSFKTPLGAYVYEESSPASIAGRIAEYDLYYVPDVSFLADKNGGVALLAAGDIKDSGGFIVTYPYDTLELCTVYDHNLKPVAEKVNIARELDGGGLIVWQAEYTDESTDESAACLTLGNHRISVISKDGKLTRLTECDKVFAISDYGAVYLKDRVIWFTSVNGETTWLSDMNPSYEYTGQVRIAEFGESPEHYYFTDAKNINENGAPMRYEWIYDPVSGYFQTNSYYAAELHENVHIIKRTY